MSDRFEGGASVTISDERLAEMLSGLDGATPSPWSWHGDELLSESRFVMATKKGSRPSDRDAKLIAAAPDLLKSMKELQEGLAAEIGDPEEWSAKLKELSYWTSSAWISGNDSEGDLRADLYKFLCDLLGYLQCGEGAARVVQNLSYPSTPQPKQTIPHT